MPVPSCTSQNLLPVIKGRSLFTASSAPCETRSWHWSETVTIDLHSVRREPDTICRTPIDSIRRTIRQTVVLTYDIRTIEVYFSWTECERLRQRQRVCPAIWHTDHSFRFFVGGKEKFTLFFCHRTKRYFSFLSRRNQCTFVSKNLTMLTRKWREITHYVY